MALPKPKTEGALLLDRTALLEAATLAIEKNDKEKALSLLRDISETPPFSSYIFFSQSLLYAKAGEPKKAIEALEKAVEIRPAFAPYQLSLGVQYLQNKRIKEAVGALEKATFLEPGKARPFLSLAMAHFATGEIPLGQKALKKFISRSFVFPFRKAIFLLQILVATGQGFLKGLFNRAQPVSCCISLSKSGVFIRFDQIQKAIAVINKSLETHPHFPALVVLLAKQYISLENLPKADSLLKEALDQYPGDVSLLVLLSKVFSSQGRVGEAHTLLNSVPPKKQSSPGFWLAYAEVLFRNNEAEKAIPYFERAAPEKENRAEFFYSYARAFGGLGRFEEAENLFLNSLNVDQTFSLAYTGLAKMGKLNPGDALFTQLLKKINNQYLPQKKRGLLNFSAGFSLEKGKEVDNAFSYFKAGNSLRDVDFSHRDWTQKVEDLKINFNSSFFKKTKGFGNNSKTPIFIVGMPRSGTTLTEQILAAHPRVFGGGERDIINIIIADFKIKIEDKSSWPLTAKYLAKPGIREMADQYLADIGRVAPGAERVTDKMPGNFWQLGLIATLFPNTKIIHCRRDPMDTCLSNFFQPYTGFHPYAYKLENLGFYYKLYQKIMAHWHKVLPIQIYDFEYEKTVSDPKGQAQKLLKYCDLEWDDNCLNFHKAKTTVQTSSFAQVRKPIYKTSTKKWKQYEAHLNPLKEALK